MGVPAKLFKVVYLPGKRIIKAFMVDNADEAEVIETDPESLQELSGIVLLPKAVVSMEIKIVQ